MIDAVEMSAVAAAEAVMHEYGDNAGPDGVPSERRERILLRPWLENLIHSNTIPGLEWIDAGNTMFKVPWKHRSKKNWSLRHSSVFLVRLSRSHFRVSRTGPNDFDNVVVIWLAQDVTKLTYIYFRRQTLDYTRITAISARNVFQAGFRGLSSSLRVKQSKSKRGHLYCA